MVALLLVHSLEYHRLAVASKSVVIATKLAIARQVVVQVARHDFHIRCSVDGAKKQALREVWQVDDASGQLQGLENRSAGAEGLWHSGGGTSAVTDQTGKKESSRSGEP